MIAYASAELCRSVKPKVYVLKTDFGFTLRCEALQLYFKNKNNNLSFYNQLFSCYLIVLSTSLAKLDNKLSCLSDSRCTAKLFGEW